MTNTGDKITLTRVSFLSTDRKLHPLWFADPNCSFSMHYPRYELMPWPKLWFWLWEGTWCSHYRVTAGQSGVHCPLTWIQVLHSLFMCGFPHCLTEMYVIVQLETGSRHWAGCHLSLKVCTHFILTWGIKLVWEKWMHLEITILIGLLISERQTVRALLLW